MAGSPPVPPPPHLCFVAHEYAAHFSEPEELLRAYHSLTDWCEALAAQGCRVSAVVRFGRDAQLTRGGINYHFVQDRHPPRLRFWDIPRRMHRHVVGLAPQVVLAHNLNKVLQHRDLLRQLSPQGIPLLLQNHAETPRFWLRNLIQRLVFSQVAAFLFCAPGQEQIWYERGIIAPGARLYHIMEGASHFHYRDRAPQRATTRLHGAPVLLWVGHLDANKDPLTLLRALLDLLPDYPGVRLYLVYRQAPLLREVQAFLADHPQLAERVSLLGERERDELEAYYNSADYFVLGSHREGSGYAAAEAMACGCVPILTDIPSYRMMSGEGKVGYLWRVGEAASLAAALRRALAGDWAEQSERVRAFYAERLSYAAIGRELMEILAELGAGTALGGED
ncbi:MAG: glycosyltransferase family 4 protein [Bacteroidota bacterium]